MDNIDFPKNIVYDSKNVICENCGLIIVKGRYRGGAKPHYMSRNCQNFKKLLMFKSAK